MEKVVQTRDDGYHPAWYFKLFRSKTEVRLELYLHFMDKPDSYLLSNQLRSHINSSVHSLSTANNVI